MTTISIEQQLSEARRELGMRKTLYPKWINSGRLAPATAEYQIAAMEAICETLRGQIRVGVTLFSPEE